MDKAALSAKTATITISSSDRAPGVRAAVTCAANEDGTAFTMNLLADASDLDTTDILGLEKLAVVSGDDR